MLTYKMTINQVVVAKLKALPQRIKRNFKTKIRTKVAPELEKDTLALMSPDPGPVSNPFAFGSRESEIYYLILVRTHPELSDGKHWKRDHEIQDAFRIKVTDYVRGDLLSITNIQRQSTGTKPWPGRYLYGPWMVQGHINTGWSAQFNAAKAILHDKAILLIIQAGNEALREAGRGEDI